MDIQVSILQLFQSIRNPMLNVLFLMLTISAEVPVIVLFIALMYWCINKKCGQKLLFLMIGNIALNTGIKEFVKAPRPIGTNGLQAMRVETATGYSFPSGHTQSATTFWVGLMTIFKKNWLYILGTIMFISIGISRLYLGVHWPIDVLFGWIFGITFTLILGAIFDIVDSNKKYYILLVLLIPFVLVAFLLNSVKYVKMLGLFTGFIIGYILEDKFVKFNTINKNNKKVSFSNKKSSNNYLLNNVCRFFIGIITLGLVYIILKYIMPSNIIFDYIRYTLIVFHAVCIVPILFKLFKLN